MFNHTGRMYDKINNSHEWAFGSSEESYESLSMNLKSTCHRGCRGDGCFWVTSNVSSDSSLLSSSVGPSAGSVLQGPYQDGGVGKAVGAPVE